MAGSAKIREILVPLDGSGTAEWALPQAATIARRSGARLHLMIGAPLAHVFPDVTAAGYLGDWEDRQEEEARYAQGVADRLNEAGPRAVAETAIGDAADRIADRAARHESRMPPCAVAVAAGRPRGQGPAVGRDDHGGR